VTTGLSRFSTLVDGLDHPEGVTVTADGTLYAGGEAGQVYRVEPGKAIEVASTGGFLLGLCADARGRLYCCDIARREVVRVDLASGATDVYTAGTAERALINPNWPLFDDAGNLYVTDSGTWTGDDGCVMRVDPSGRTTIWSEESTNFPNGACLSADGSSLLVLESLTPALVRIPIRADGSAGTREVIAMLPDTVPDGVALDEDGNAFVFCYRPDRILRVAPDGSVEIVADDPLGTTLGGPANGVFVGADRKDLVVSNLSRWHLTISGWETPGIPLHYPELA
jgi:gluconolactonase